MSRKVLLIKKKVFAVHVSNLRLFLFLARAAFVCILPISNVLLPRTHECTITCRLLRWVLSPVSVIAWVEVGALESEQSRARCIAVLLSSPEKTISSSTAASASASVRFKLFCKLTFIFSLLPASWPSPLFPIVQSALSTRPLSVLLVLCSCSAPEVSGISPVILKA